MREIYYYLLFGACLYFVLTRVLKYYVDNNQQENFDPHPYQGKNLAVIYKCGLNGNAKYGSFGDGDTVPSNTDIKYPVLNIW